MCAFSSFWILCLFGNLSKFIGGSFLLHFELSSLLCCELKSYFHYSLISDANVVFSFVCCDYLRVLLGSYLLPFTFRMGHKGPHISIFLELACGKSMNRSKIKDATHAEKLRYRSKYQIQKMSPKALDNFNRPKEWPSSKSIDWVGPKSCFGRFNFRTGLEFGRKAQIWHSLTFPPYFFVIELTNTLFDYGLI